MPTGMHSPWGTIYQIVKETGWSWHEVLWKVSRTNLMMMMADRPGFRRAQADKKPVQKITGKGLAARLRGK